MIKADAADEAHMAALFAELGKSLPPLRGIIHAAGVVSAQALDAMDESSIREVLKPKVQGA